MYYISENLFCIFGPICHKRYGWSSKPGTFTLKCYRTQQLCLANFLYFIRKHICTVSLCPPECPCLLTF
jgi:hypothetical protein